MRHLALLVPLALILGCGDKGGSSSGGGGGGGGGGTPPPSGGGGVDYSTTGHPITWITSDPAITVVEDDINTLVNNHRTSIALGALTHLQLMRETARGHSYHMTGTFHDFFAHTNPEGDGPTQRYSKAGGTGGCGENIAAGYPTATDAFNGWMGSPGHKANIETPGYTKTGIGYSPDTIPLGPYTKVYTQMFQ